MKPFKKAMLIFMVIFSLFLVSVGAVDSASTTAKDNKEIGPTEVQGKVLSIVTHPFGQWIIEVKSDQTDEVYTFYVGHNTAYVPHRFPAVGETIKVRYGSNL